ncbi:alpha/beta fold hydrolase [Aestuariibacter halophilus]|uniref:Alpha/beta fold hydrolase n=1 Tax=Fluctibacter halophilus TaxID=226011 RepID=A0ABS8G8J5_9ALTE|nr:alpha/beta hydrolase [Aestuariibacter halophilus]MCC2616481.1 alpha/beta fold hydrolase [Aestuariibacter halophilus]
MTQQWPVNESIELCVDDLGNRDAPVVLLIMGLGMQLIHWHDGFCQSLVDRGFRVIRFDNRDAGQSTHLHALGVPGNWLLTRQRLGMTRTSAYSLTDMAEDGWQLLDQLDVQQAHLFGASMGGMIAQTMALQQPKRSLTMTSVMSSPGAPLRPGPNWSLLMHMARTPRRDKDGFLQHTLALWHRLNGTVYPFDRDYTAALIQRAQQRGMRVGSLRRQLSAILTQQDRRSALASLKVPSLVIHGKADPLVPFAQGQATAQALGNGRLLAIEHMGHTLPQAVWPDILDNWQAMTEQR